MRKLNTTSLLIIMILSFATLLITGIITTKSADIVSDLSIASLLLLSLLLVRTYKNRFTDIKK